MQSDTHLYALLSLDELKKAQKSKKHRISLCTDGDLQVVQRLDSARRYRVAGIEFNEGGVFPLGDAGFAASPRRPFVNDRFIPQPESPDPHNPFSQQPPERFVDADALAEHLSVARRQVLEMTRRGIIPGHPLGVGRSRKVWRYKISEVESALASAIRKPSCESNNDDLARPSNDVTIRPGSSPSQRRKSNG